MRPYNHRGINLMRPVFVHRGPMDTPCILWTGSILKTGYGAVQFNRRTSRVHRVVFFLTRGEWPNVCRHKCDVRACYNPLHLEDGTTAQNVQDMVSRGRHPRARLMENDVREIRRLLKEIPSPTVVARLFNVDRSTICDIKHGRSWKWVSDS